MNENKHKSANKLSVIIILALVLTAGVVIVYTQVIGSVKELTEYGTMQYKKDVDSREAQEIKKIEDEYSTLMTLLYGFGLLLIICIVAILYLFSRRYNQLISIEERMARLKE